MDDYQRARVFRTDLLARSSDPAADVRDNILDYLRSSGKNYSDLARQMGTSRQNVSHAVSGEHVPTAKTLVPIAEVLGCDVTDLLSIRRPVREDNGTYATIQLRVPMDVLKEPVREGTITNG